MRKTYTGKRLALLMVLLLSVQDVGGTALAADGGALSAPLVSAAEFPMEAQTETITGEQTVPPEETTPEEQGALPEEIPTGEPAAPPEESAPGSGTPAPTETTPEQAADMAGPGGEETGNAPDNAGTTGQEPEPLAAGNAENPSAAPALTGVYYEFQTLEEILELCEQGLDLQEFFQYTIWGFLTPELIQGLVENGHTLDDVYAVLESGGFDAPEDIMAVVNAYASVPVMMALGDTRTAGFSGAMSETLGNLPALGSGSHGPILRIHLGGETAFCGLFGAACRTGMTYTSVPLGEIGIDDNKAWLIQGLLSQYQDAQAIYQGPVNYIMTQACIWMVLNGTWTGDPEGMAQAIAPLFGKTLDLTVESATDYFKAIVGYVNDGGTSEKIAAMSLEGWANGPNQYLITGSRGDAPLEEAGPYARVELVKTDSETGNVIAYDASFSLYEWNGTEYEPSDVAVYREGDKYVSDHLMFTEENEGKFCLEETLAPADGTATGYYGDFAGGAKRRYEFTIAEDAEGEPVSITNNGSTFANVRTTGSITVYKTDIEADRYVAGETSHGIATLDGAIYDLYAAADIYHPDGVTGVVYPKDTLVASGTIAGGRCSYTGLYLGSYYVKERQKGETLPDGKKLSYASGYLLDETTYYVTLPYEGETVADVHRELTSDEEQVVKAKAVFEKVESATGQGNINYLAGAGFTIYRIDRLSKVSQFPVRADGTYDIEAIKGAYLVENYDQDTPKYDFSGETAAIATLYLNNDSERADTAFYYGDGMADVAAGRLIPLGGHYYRVAELFSDGNGQVATPYLPYGQYLVVETAVPADHFQAPPFVLTFNEGRTTKAITVGVTEATPYGHNLLKSAGDAAASYEAVYFSQILDNEAVEQLLKIYKKDADTGKTVLLADTKFRIAKVDEATGEKTYLTHTLYYPDTENKEIFATNAQGYLQLPELLPVGLYQIEEVQGPEGFYNDIPGGFVQFRVTTDREYVSLLGAGPEGSTLEGSYGRRDVLLIVEDYYNRETRGVLTLQKLGEVLDGYETTGFIETIREWLGMEAEKQFVYEVQPLSGAEYTIRAAEDIYTQDRQLGPDGNRTLWFAKGETVAVVTTGEAGQVDGVKVPTEDYPEGHPIVTVFHEGTLGSVKIYLPLGSYEIEETKAPYGYTRSTGPVTVTFTWEHQYQEFVFSSDTEEIPAEFAYDPATGTLANTNARVKATPRSTEGLAVAGIGVYKRAKEADAPLPGVSFGLYTVHDIYTRDGRLIAGAGELLSVCETDADGLAYFDTDVPIRDEFYGEKELTNSGAYEIRELDAPNGIELDPAPIPVQFAYVDDATEYVVITMERQNRTSEVFVSKQDITNGAELAGAALTVTEDWTGNVVQGWTSDGTLREIRGLSVNETVEDDTFVYTLREEAAPAGFSLAESIQFKLVKAQEPENQQPEEPGQAGQPEQTQPTEQPGQAGQPEQPEQTEQPDADTPQAPMNTVYVYDREAKAWVLAAGNTVVMKDRPVPTTPRSGDGPEDGPEPEPEPVELAAPKTGDDAPLALYGGLLILCSGALVLLWIAKRKLK